MKKDIQDEEYFLQLDKNFKESILYIDQKLLKYNLFQEDILNEIKVLKQNQKDILEELLIDLYTNSCRSRYLQQHKINKKLVQSSIKKKIAINYMELIKILQHREDWIEQLDIYCQIQSDKILQKKVNDEAQYKELSQDFQNLSLKATKIVKLHDKFDGLRISDNNQQQVDSKKSKKETCKIQLKNNLLNQDLDLDQNGCEDKLHIIQEQLKEFKGMNLWSNVTKVQRETMFLELKKYQDYNQIKQEYLYFCSKELESKFVFKFSSMKMINYYQNWFNNCSILETLEQNLQICQGNIQKINQTKQQVIQRIDDIKAILENDLQ